MFSNRPDSVWNQKGLTLIELVIVIAILAIIATVAIPRIQLMLARQEMQNISILIPQILRNARHEAFLRRNDIVVCSSNDGLICTNHSLWQNHIITFVDTNHNRQKDQHEEIISSQFVNAKYATITRIGARHANYIMFKSSNALPQGSQGSFYYCSLIDKSLNRRIILNGMGWHRIEKLDSCS